MIYKLVIVWLLATSAIAYRRRGQASSSAKSGGKGSSKYNETHNPCTRELPKKPNYDNIKSISQFKCLDLMWQARIREEKAKNTKECWEYNNKKSHSHGVGYRPAEPGEFPHMGAIGWKAAQGDGYVFKCAGSIISEKFLVTAAHCSKSGRDSRISNQVPEIVRMGTADLLATAGRKYPHIENEKIIRIIVHPNYKSPKQYYDIALMELEKALSSFSRYIQPACILSSFVREGAVSASGWGITRVGQREAQTQLGVGDLELINSTLCDSLLRPMCNRYWCGLEQHQLCAGKLAGGVDPCQGDSGGPLQLVANTKNTNINQTIYVVVGVTAFGFGCARANSPGVYTRISSFIDWIEQNVWPDDYARRRQ